jgi:uncharacterized spore protein YtfJ
VAKGKRLNPAGDGAALTIRRTAARLTGARLCYGKPIEVERRTVVPVASLRTIGGLGFGHGPPRQLQDAPDAGGGGGGGYLEARPIGFIEIDPDGARFVAIEQTGRPYRALATATLALASAVGARSLGRRGASGLRRRASELRRAGRVRPRLAGSTRSRRRLPGR